MTSLPAPYAAARIAAFLDDRLSWSAWWDKHYGLWRVAVPGGAEGVSGADPPVRSE